MHAGCAMLGRDREPSVGLLVAAACALAVCAGVATMRAARALAALLT